MARYHLVVVAVIVVFALLVPLGLVPDVAAGEPPEENPGTACDNPNQGTKNAAPQAVDASEFGRVIALTRIGCELPDEG